MINKPNIDYNELFQVNSPFSDNWCKHKKRLWQVLMNHLDNYFNSDNSDLVKKEEVISFIQKYFESNNFAYAYYCPINDDPLFLIAKSTDAKNHFHQVGDLASVFDSIYSELGIIFCTSTKNSGYFKFHRVDEDLSFREQGVIDPTIKFLATQQTCCERMIFENIVTHLYKEEAFLENFQIQLDGKIKIYTEFEPCIRCYGLMNSIKEKYKLDIKVYYEEWFPAKFQKFADLNSITNIFDKFPKNAFDKNNELKKEVLDEILNLAFYNGIPLNTAYARVAQRMNKGTNTKCDYKSSR
ncbi:hypothetical protein BC30048_2944 [Bacillus cereus]|uniref:hypothetical protein n=1 Tax=Bacillus cereus TaxID=1396 RepID=UPI001BA871E3|nr:hypothetical protein [Bacillus cereus]MBR9685748.1 hypothetical protein [Bacillus cereus]MEB9966475.1 hypothetical protein [Bacillus cereus]BCD00042.1 hypothetical protein BC30048_2944 [Bacillus cereus]